MENRGTRGRGFHSRLFYKALCSCKGEREKGEGKKKANPEEAEADEQKAKATSPSKYWGCGSEESIRRGTFGQNADLKGLGTESKTNQPSSALPLPNDNNDNEEKKSFFLAAFRPGTRFYGLLANSRAMPGQ